MTMTFGNGAAVELTSEGAYWRTWELTGGKHTAEVFKLSDSPGALRNGNTLCGGENTEENLYAVFYEQTLFDLPATLALAVFQSVKPPFDINSPGLCGTYTYNITTHDEAKSSNEIASSMAENAETGSWRVRKTVNPIDDTKTVTLSLEAEVGTSSYGEPITFVARCKSNKTEAYVIWGDYLGDDSGDIYSEWKNVTVRIGNDQAIQERWGVSTDRKATFAPDWAGNLLKQLLDEDRLVLQTIPYGENPNTAIFDISGFRSVLGELAGTCNWSY
ncbi:hypothetical protein [Roseovarius salis]|uniref:hypothetical protein n=1 Tax=Roseovarius salis TaxID=3376063 RepID=UPI0037C8C882